MFATTYEVKAPIACQFVETLVKEGELVRSGQVLVVVLSMKLQYEVKSPTAAVVNRINYLPGDRVAAGDILVELLPE